jgi:hypothetical protein
MAQSETPHDRRPDAGDDAHGPRHTQPRQAALHGIPGGSMHQLPTCEWTGVSGTTYTFHVHVLPAGIEPDQMGNYIYACWTPERRWLPIYIGEGNLSDAASERRHRAASIWLRGATHFHCHVNPDGDARRREELDLLSRYPSAVKPAGGTERPG